MLSRKLTPMLFLMLLLVPACAASRDTVITRTSMGLTAARAAFTAEDERQQMLIVASAQSKAEGEAKLAEHRKWRDGVTKVFQSAWTALAVASMDPTDRNMQALADLARQAVSATQARDDPIVHDGGTP